VAMNSIGEILLYTREMTHGIEWQTRIDSMMHYNILYFFGKEKMVGHHIRMASIDPQTWSINGLLYAYRLMIRNRNMNHILR
jgi:hypothetical protein